MDKWIAVFVMMVAIAALVQTALLAAMFVFLRRGQQRLLAITEDLHLKVTPVLAAVQSLVEETRPQIAGIVSDAAEISRLTRTQAQRLDRVVGEGLERLRGQLVRVDEIITGTMDTVEDAGDKLRRNVMGPVQSVVAVVRGIQTGLEYFRDRNMRRPPVDTASDSPDDTLFI